MLEHLFGSKTRFKLLKFLFHDPEQAFFVRELTRALDAHIHAVRREIQLLLEMGILLEVDPPSNVESTSKGKPGTSLRKYYLLNKKSQVYEELKALLLKSQVLGEQKFTKEILDKAGDIKLFIVTGRFTGENTLQTDLLIVGEVKPRNLEKIIKKYEKNFGFEIRYTIMTETEYSDRRYIMDKFLYSVLESKQITVIDVLNS